MAKSHKDAGRSIEVVSGLSAEQLVNLCQEAASQCKIRREAVKSGVMVFSVRAMLKPETNRLMVFEVRLSRDGDGFMMKSQIVSYKTVQSKYLGLIPLGPRRLVGLQVYDKFLQRFEELVCHLDSEARVSVEG
jgi:hypothetical protein